MHSVSGILGYKINFDTNGDAEFNLTLLDMQPIGKLMLILAFPQRLEGYSRDQGFALPSHCTASFQALSVNAFR